MYVESNVSNAMTTFTWNHTFIDIGRQLTIRQN